MAALPPNPIIPGFSPDPSVCLIGDTFFLVNSSFHIFPGLPIYSSTDLANWKYIGNAINRQSQLSLRTTSTTITPPDAEGNRLCATGGLYAPTIRHRNGVAYIICTNLGRRSPDVDGGTRTDNFIIHTSDISSGEWSDPIYYEFNGIDPSILFDDDGRVYIQGSDAANSKIYNAEVDISTGKLLTEMKLIWEGWDKRWTEGPHIYKKDGWYYLLTAEGGTFSEHMVSMARSKNIWGPYEANERNPIWTAKGTSNYIQHTGHAELFQDTQGRWWIAMLGVRKKGDRYIMGRESFLSPVEWETDRWPVVSPVLSDIHSRAFPPRQGQAPIQVEGDIDWVYVREPDLSLYKLDLDDIQLYASKHDLSSPDFSPSFVGKRQRRLEGEASILLHTPVTLAGKKLRAGIAMYKDEHRWIEAGWDFKAQGAYLRGMNRARDFEVKVEVDLLSGASVLLKITYDEDSYSFGCAKGQTESWRSLGSVDTAQLSGYDFTGPIIGVFATGEEAEVHFDGLRVD